MTDAAAWMLAMNLSEADCHRLEVVSKMPPAERVAALVSLPVTQRELVYDLMALADMTEVELQDLEAIMGGCGQDDALFELMGAATPI